MTRDEFLSTFKQRGATTAPGISTADITRTNVMLQGMRAAIMPGALTDFYTACGGMFIGSGYIFGPHEIARGTAYPVPSITDINKEMAPLTQTANKTVFGRNDLFLFAFDAFGTFYMLDNLNMRPLRKYDNLYNAMTDCLAAGQI